MTTRIFSTATWKARCAAIALRSRSVTRRLVFDFTGSAPQLTWARNIPHQALLATVYTVAKSLLDPDVPTNAGYFGTIADRGAAGQRWCSPGTRAVGCRSISCGVLGDVIAVALCRRPCRSRRWPASGPHHLCGVLRHRRAHRRYFVNYETVAGGMGARAYRDGMDGGPRARLGRRQSAGRGAWSTPIRCACERYALRDGSGGDGMYRGGSGVVRDYEVLAEALELSLAAERQHAAAVGSAGGGAGALGSFVLNPGTPDERQLPSATADLVLNKGEVLSIRTPGGGGFGPPAGRAHEVLARDLRDGRLSREHAEEECRAEGGHTCT